MAVEASDALRDALTKLANDLDPLIDQADLSKQLALAARLRSAQNDLNDAASIVSALTIEQALKDSVDLAKLQTLTAEIATKADDIAKQEKNTARIVGIAAGAITLAGALNTGNIAGILKAVSDMQQIID